jgi:DNA-binding phage protein
MAILQLAEVYKRQVGADEQISREAFNDEKIYFKELDRLLDELFEESSTRGLTWGQLAEKAGVSTKTVQNLGERWTKRPQFRTVMLIASALGQKIELVSKKAVPKLRIAKAG